MSEKVIAQLCEQWQNTACKGMGEDRRKVCVNDKV